MKTTIIYALILFSITILLSACSTKEAEITSTPPKSKVILALWDSLTAGYGLPADQSYPAQLQTKLATLGYNYAVQNAGISWDTSAQLLARTDWIIDGGTYDLAILCIGANDAFQWKNVADIEKNIRAVIEKLQVKKIPIFLAGMRAPLNLGTSYRAEYDTLFEKLADEYNLVFMPFFLEWVALRANLNQDDRIHPTSAWYAIIVENILEILEDEDLIKK